MRLPKLLSRSKRENKKSIVFVTGVPGAGKTLVGLHIASSYLDPDDQLYSVYLSGNGPLVKILQEALARDKVARLLELGETLRIGQARSEVKALIRNVHHFRDDGLASTAAPVEHVAIFDESQRAWDRAQTSKFMKSRKGVPDFDQSESEFLISRMNRHEDWAVVVCLVGGGQEINTGETGIQGWFEAPSKSFPHWGVYAPEGLADEEYGGENL
ncbi:MAG: hypothetical protein ACI8Z1_003435 [Candidatus Azotimanducaceae bacterium]|jgi:hypothetical protein